ncbi:hypothetical protein RDWZM_005964 [Blomia tropicalis]|uniref:Nbr1 FW domain-containing protein n=1 Tax=Blomia tropicalis TaxID=40697 RepID=A0A9Q0M8R3_BLOTA|nr:hypothetical protein RDWZM_005964 [Blomia tropicalis]
MDVDFGDVQAGGNSGDGGGGGDDITSELLQKFSCMNTTDREVLIQQFKVLLGEKCSETSAEFWLDMNNWNLQAAVCSYFDYENQNSSYLIKLPSMSFISDPNFVDRWPPNSSFTYHCIVTNSGDEPWPLGCSLRFCGGTQMSHEERVLLPGLIPGQSADVKLSMISPNSVGGHSCQWRPATLTGQFFGETIFIIINVTDDQMLQSVTQQLSDAHLSMDLNQSKDNVAYSMPQPSSASLLPLIPTPSSVSIATTIFPNSNSNQFTPGMCLPGSTAAGYTAPMDEHHQSSNSLSNGILPSNNDTAIVQAQQQQQQQQQLLFSIINFIVCHWH